MFTVFLEILIKEGKCITVLSDLDAGDVAVVVSVETGNMATRRVYDMGLCVGTSFRIISKLHRGPIQIEVRDTRLVLGRGISQKIFVERQV